jgi:hypothetical protein
MAIAEQIVSVLPRFALIRRLYICFGSSEGGVDNDDEAL